MLFPAAAAPDPDKQKDELPPGLAKKQEGAPGVLPPVEPAPPAEPPAEEEPSPPKIAPGQQKKANPGNSRIERPVETPPAETPPAQPSQPSAPPATQQPPAGTPPVTGQPGAGERRTAAERRAARERRRAARRRAARRRAARSTPGAPAGVGAAVADVAAASPPTPAPARERRASGRPKADAQPKQPEESGESLPERVVPRVVERIVENVPAGLWALLAGLAAFLVLALVGSWLTAARSRRLKRQRNELLQEVGLLQAALLPSVPEELAEARVSVAYRPAEGPAAGGDFYDAFMLPAGRLGLLIGDVAGHGRQALAQTALVRFTLRAYLEAGLEPRTAIAIAGDALDDKVGVEFVTVVSAVYDPAERRLTYAAAGHPPPLIAGPGPAPVLAASSPPIGAGLRTGMRQTSLTLAPDTSVLLYTDGVVDARLGEELFGEGRLAEVLGSLEADADAEAVLERVAGHTAARDDMAACLLRTPSGVPADDLLVQELVVDADDLAGSLPSAFLEACGVSRAEVPVLLRTVEPIVHEHGGAIVRLTWQDGVRSIRTIPPDRPQLDPDGQPHLSEQLRRATAS